MVINHNLQSSVYGGELGFYTSALRHTFIENNMDFGLYREQVMVLVSLDELFLIVRKILEVGPAVVFMSGIDPESTMFTVRPRKDEIPILQLMIQFTGADGFGATESPPDSCLHAYITVMGDPQIAQGVIRKLNVELESRRRDDKRSMIKWIFSNADEYAERFFQLEKKVEILDEAYPWITGNGGSLKDYYNGFIASAAQILILYGPPGTGKTSFIRDLVCETGLNLVVSYDLKMLQSDSTFVNYMSDKLFDGILFEDADELLTSEREDHNKIIAKLLNVSDGLIKLPRKKLIFTTNLENVSEIDDALTRPGRCFDVVEFRELTNKEAQAIAVKLDVELKEERKYSLAEVFALSNLNELNDPNIIKNRSKLAKATVGFY
jgi:SpoVK/Ycf46/Vps4 family AAA+-type ATPase